jgi:CheY-like chemotaxis protein
VLVVDDNVDAAVMLAELLRELGCETETVHDPVAALRVCEALEPELALLDIGLPVMDGYELARQLRARGCTAALVAVTGYGQDADRRRSREAGFDAHLVKPVAIDALHGVLRAIRPPARPQPPPV